MLRTRHNAHQEDTLAGTSDGQCGAGKHEVDVSDASSVLNLLDQVHSGDYSRVLVCVQQLAGGRHSYSVFSTLLLYAENKRQGE